MPMNCSSRTVGSVAARNGYVSAHGQADLFGERSKSLFSGTLTHHGTWSRTWIRLLVSAPPLSCVSIPSWWSYGGLDIPLAFIALVGSCGGCG